MLLTLKDKIALLFTIALATYPANTRINPPSAPIMPYSSDEPDDELPDLKVLLERYCLPVQAQRESAAPLELFEPVTPPKASKPGALKGAVGDTAEKAAIGTAGGLGEGQDGVKTPVTVIRKPRTVSKLLDGKPEVVKKKPGRVADRKVKGVLVEGPDVIGRPVEPAKTKSLADSFRERPTVPAILDSSDSEEEEERPEKQRASPQLPAFTKFRRGRKIVLDSDDEFTPEEDSEGEVEQLDIKKFQRLTIDLTSSSESEGKGSKRSTVSSTRRKGASSEDEGFKSQDSSRSFKPPSEAILSYSPPQSTKPSKVFRLNRPAQGAGTTRKLDPPNKTTPVIPPSPHHPTSDLFWDERETSSWIDTHSPQKKPPTQMTHFQTPNLMMMPEETVALSTSPTKDSKEQRALKKSFDAKKKALAEEFLKRVDDEITGGEVGSKSASTGGVKIIWSKTLRTTAGMAKWKKEKLRLPNGHVAMGDQEPAVQVRHHATIELSEKVVDSEGRAAQCTHAFSHLGVNVTTTHSYEIQYRYQWTCQNFQCRHVYKRHSQSIDPRRHTCGACTGGKLLQTKPEKRPITGYQTFMKENFSRIKAENPGKPQKDLMSLVGKEYREAKARSEDAKKGNGFVETGEKEGALEDLLGGLLV